MVPDKFNMVDMGGIDLIEMQGETVPGLYEKLVESITQCRYQCLYNWMFNGVIIPPTYVQLEVNDNDEVSINEGVTIDEEDVIHIHSLEIIIEPVIQELNVNQNGEYLVPEGVHGFNPVTVEVIPPLQQKTVTANGNYEPDDGYYGLNKVIVNVISRYEYLEPNYVGIGYSYVALDGGYWDADSYGQCIAIYDCQPGDYVMFLPVSTSTRFRSCVFYNKESADFIPYTQISQPQVRLFGSDINVTGSVEITDMTKRFYVTLSNSGCIVIGTSNVGVLVKPILLKINS